MPGPKLSCPGRPWQTAGRRHQCSQWSTWETLQNTTGSGDPDLPFLFTFPHSRYPPIHTQSKPPSEPPAGRTSCLSEADHSAWLRRRWSFSAKLKADHDELNSLCPVNCSTTQLTKQFYCGVDTDGTWRENQGEQLDLLSACNHLFHSSFGSNRSFHCDGRDFRCEKDKGMLFATVVLLIPEYVGEK